jgi:hypothetical protein
MQLMHSKSQGGWDGKLAFGDGKPSRRSRALQICWLRPHSGLKHFLLHLSSPSLCLLSTAGWKSGSFRTKESQRIPINSRASVIACLNLVRTKISSSIKGTLRYVIWQVSSQLLQGIQKKKRRLFSTFDPHIHQMCRIHAPLRKRGGILRLQSPHNERRGNAADHHFWHLENSLDILMGHRKRLLPSGVQEYSCQVYKNGRICDGPRVSCSMRSSAGKSAWPNENFPDDHLKCDQLARLLYWVTYASNMGN